MGSGFGQKPDEIVVVGLNLSRKANDEELLNDFGIMRCDVGDCDSKLRELGLSSIATLDLTPLSEPAQVPATSTVQVKNQATGTGDNVKPGGGSVGDAIFPRQTLESETGL